MRRSVTRFLISVVFLAVTALSVAQGFTAEELRDILANEMNEVAIECPDAYSHDLSCIRASGSVDLTRSRVDLELGRFTDVRPMSPWEEMDYGSVGRGWLIDAESPPGAVHGFTIYIGDSLDRSYEALIIVSKFGVYDAEGDPID